MSRLPAGRRTGVGGTGRRYSRRPDRLPARPRDGREPGGDPLRAQALVVRAGALRQRLPAGLALREDRQRRVRRTVQAREAELLVPGVAAHVQRQPAGGQLRRGVLLAAVVAVLLVGRRRVEAVGAPVTRA